MTDPTEATAPPEDLIFTEPIVARVLPLYRRYLLKRSVARLSNEWPRLVMGPLSVAGLLYLMRDAPDGIHRLFLVILSVALAAPAFLMVLDLQMMVRRHRSLARAMTGLVSRIRATRSGSYRLPMARTRTGLVFGTGKRSVRRELPTSKYLIEDGGDLWLIAFDDEHGFAIPTAGLSTDTQEFIRRNVVCELAGHYPLSRSWRR